MYMKVRARVRVCGLYIEVRVRVSGFVEGRGILQGEEGEGLEHGRERGRAHRTGHGVPGRAPGGTDKVRDVVW